ncbi:MAG: riboflavin kinase, partial [Verrucomicrobiota bacterium]|nr:riboflavin kinase [Verrucomicrobiota bacterium]
QWLQKGLQAVLLQPLDPQFSQREATGFVEFLCAHIPTLHTLCIGRNFRFGKNRIGDHLLLRESANAFGLQVLVAESESWGDGPISSSRIRAALEEGRIVDVNQMLGRKYLMEGMVCSGNAVGRTIGFPTLNLNWNPQAHPCFGVYAGMVKNLRNDQKLPAVANYGVRPTLEKSSCEPLLEIHLLVEPDTEQWRTGVELHMELDFFLRPEKAFAALDDLKAQIQSDKNQALELRSPL